MAFDVIVIGAGPNGLTLAATAARRGRKVVVCERREIVGGIAAVEEFHPGYRGAGLLHDTTGVRPAVVRGLELERHGLRLRSARPDVLALGAGGSDVWIPGDVGKAPDTIGKVSRRDAGRFVEYRAFADRLRGPATRWLDAPPLDVIRFESIGKVELAQHALRLRMLGQRDMTELMRVLPMPVADCLDEWFETPALQAALALPALEGTFTGPRAPGTTANLLRLECLAGPGVRGGGPALVSALERAAADAGVTLRTSAHIERLIHDGKGVQGVVLRGGEQIAAPAVAASCDPQQALLDLLPPASIPYRVAANLRHFRRRGVMAQVLLALDRPPVFHAAADEAVQHARVADDLNAIERAFDAVKYRRVSHTPVLDVHVPTVESPQLAPEGHAVISMLVHCAPYDLEGGWNAGASERLAAACVRILGRHCPDIARSIVGRAVFSPVDLESRYALPSGHAYHGEHTLDQLLIRPAPGCIGYRTPVPGLFLCGSASHPGGGLTCAPGHLAAQALLR